MLLNSQVDRMVEISLKGGIVAAAGYFLSASTLQKFVPLERQKDYSEVLEEAKKLGIHYFKLPTKEATDFL